MRFSTMAFFLSALLFLVVIATEGVGNDSSPPGAIEPAVVSSRVLCLPAENEMFFFGMEVGGSGSGGVLGVAGGGIGVEGRSSTNCVEGIAALVGQIPAPPLCLTSTHPTDFAVELFVVCSGPARNVIPAIGDLAKAVIALP